MGTPRELIGRRRRQILVHSVIYYRFNTSIIEDVVFDLWSDELAELQAKYPTIASECVYAEAFDDFDGDSGFDLPYVDPHIVGVASRLLEIHEQL